MEIDPDSLARSPFLIGGLGALVTAVRFTPGASWPERIANVMAGALVSGYATPALVEYVGMSSHAYQSAAAFVLGLLGMSLLASVLEHIKKTPFGQLITDLMPGRKGQ